MISSLADKLFSKTYELPLSRTYVAHWGLVEAVRELIQNALDSDSPFEYAFDNGTLYISSRFAKLEASTLVLGATSKTGATDKIGSFGEGYKIAMLVLTREGYPLTILNGDKQWSPEFKVSSTFGAEVLHINESPVKRQERGVDFIISGLSDAECEAIREICLRMQPVMKDVIGTKYGLILPSKPGKLYVGTLFVCDTDLKYGYDINPEYLALERDRQTVSGWSLSSLTKDCWIEHCTNTGNLDLLAEMIDKEFPDVEHVRYGSTELVKEACYRLFQKKHPGAIAVGTQEELDRLVSRGMTSVIRESSLMYSQVSATAAHKQVMGGIVRVQTPTEALEEWFADNKKYMSRLPIVGFKSILERAKDWRNK